MFGIFLLLLRIGWINIVSKDVYILIYEIIVWEEMGRWIIKKRRRKYYVLLNLLSD